MFEATSVTASLDVDRYLSAEDWRPSSSLISEAGELGRDTPTSMTPLIVEVPVSIDDARRGAPGWFEPTLRRITELLRLSRNWSSYRAEPIRPGLAVALLGLLSEVMADDTPAPAVVPTASGGLQAEWHRRGYDLEIEVTSTSRFATQFANLETGEVESREVVSDLRPLVQWIAAITG